MTTKKPSDGVAEPAQPSDHPKKCTARRRNGEPCGAWARRGYRVCRMHGAGTRKREKDGSRQPPGRPPVHGIYSARAKMSAAAATADYEGAQDELYRLDAVTARAWVMLEHADRGVTLCLKWMEQIEQRDEPGLEPGDLTILQALNGAMGAAERALGRLESLSTTRAKLNQGDGAISRIEMIAILRLVGAWVRELAADDRVPRDRIADALFERVSAYAAGAHAVSGNAAA